MTEYMRKDLRRVNIKRVERMIEVFRKLPAKMIQLNTYMITDRFGETVAEAKAHECGTMACLAGHVALEFAPRSAVIESEYIKHGKKVTWVRDAAEVYLGTNYAFSWLYKAQANHSITQRAEALQRLRKLLKLAKKAQAGK